MISFQSRENFLKGDKNARDSRVESFLSKMKPLDFLGIPKNIDLDNLDDSIVKTPKREHKETLMVKKDMKIAPFSEFDNDEQDSISERKSRRNSNINIKNFDDFKNVLKDVKMSLNISYYSEFHEDW